MTDDPHQVGAGRWKVPAGSIIVDIGLVIMMVFTAGQLTQTVKNLDSRLVVVENRTNGLTITPEAARRISVLEEQQRQAEQQRAKIEAYLSRIEHKLDEHMERSGLR